VIHQYSVQAQEAYPRARRQVIGVIGDSTPEPGVMERLGRYVLGLVGLTNPTREAAIMTGLSLVLAVVGTAASLWWCRR
jgi:hypothetical protein